MIIRLMNLGEIDEKHHAVIHQAVKQGNPVLDSLLLLKNWLALPTCKNNKGRSNLKIFKDISSCNEVTLDLTDFFNIVEWNRPSTWKSYIRRRYLDEFSAVDVFEHINRELCRALFYFENVFFDKDKTVPARWATNARKTFLQFHECPEAYMDKISHELKMEII